MLNTSFLGLTSQFNFKKPETMGSIAYNKKPETMGSIAFVSTTETMGSIASAGSSVSSGSTPSGCGSSCNVCA